ncbi:MAG: MBOAT family O-acyltransferase [Planctomycetota bacterium]|jgi:D-alanyl-lipoteichoic acid acyltransferase DltB (MBOAT superfamily)
MSWKAEYAILIATTTIVAYTCALLTGVTESKAKKKFYLTISLVVNLGLLFSFKYFNFVSDSLCQILARFSLNVNTPTLRVLLPVGISFYTFQTLSYSIDVYYGKIKPEKHLGIFALYVSFFPQLVAGPIERATHLLGQFKKQKTFDVERFYSGIQLILWGLFKKVVIADRLAVYVNTIYNNVPRHSGVSFIVATYFFAFQIYCDFSAYSDIAIGTAKILGFDLMKNFNRPYFATTAADFWHRWHISLSTWLRDYLYIPLGGNRKGTARTHYNLIITMFLGGIWHGANWTFIIWGTLHGILLIVSKITQQTRDKIYEVLKIPRWVIKSIRILITFHLVCLCWIFFRANTVSDAFYIITHLLHRFPKVFIEQLTWSHGISAIAVLLFVELLQSRGELGPKIQKAPLPVRWALYSAVVFGIILFGVTEGAEFIYFQF